MLSYIYGVKCNKLDTVVKHKILLFYAGSIECFVHRNYVRNDQRGGMLTTEQIIEQIEEVLEHLEPYFLMHGGNIAFDRFDPASGAVYVKLSGACSGCASSSYTLKLLVESELKKEVPQVVKVEEVE